MNDATIIKTLTWLAVAAILIGVIIWWNQPTCLRGHYEDEQRPGYYSTTYVKVGDILVPMTHWVPPHTVQCWVCDEYEKEE